MELQILDDTNTYLITEDLKEDPDFLEHYATLCFDHKRRSLTEKLGFSDFWVTSHRQKLPR